MDHALIAQLVASGPVGLPLTWVLDTIIGGEPPPIVGMATVGSVPSCTAEVLVEAVCIAEASVALVGWLLPGAGAASVDPAGAVTGRGPFSRISGVTADCLGRSADAAVTVRAGRTPAPCADLPM
jgi:hypothetical protein